MKLASGTPVIDGIGWIGAVMATIGDTVLVIELGATDALNAAWYRTYKASALWLDGDIAYAVRGEMVDVAAVLASWQRRQCSKNEVFAFAPARRHAAPARSDASRNGKGGMTELEIEVQKFIDEELPSFLYENPAYEAFLDGLKPGIEREFHIKLIAMTQMLPPEAHLGFLQETEAVSRFYIQFYPTKDRDDDGNIK